MCVCVSLSRSLCISLSLCVSLSLSIYLVVTVCLSHSRSLSLSLSHSLTVSLSLSLYPSFSLSLYPSLSLSLSLSLPLSLSPSPTCTLSLTASSADVHPFPHCFFSGTLPAKRVATLAGLQAVTQESDHPAPVAVLELFDLSGHDSGDWSEHVNVIGAISEPVAVNETQ